MAALFSGRSHKLLVDGLKKSEKKFDNSLTKPDINIVETKELTDRQVMEGIRLIYLRRKRADRLTQEELALEIGIGRPTLWFAIIKKVASKNTLRVLREYLIMNNNEVSNVKKD